MADKDTAKAQLNKPSRNFGLIFYPEDFEEGDTDFFFDFADKIRYKMWVSPLHNQDVTEDGQPKKPHYHVVIALGSKTTKRLSGFRALLVRVFGEQAKHWKVQPLGSLRESVRYLAHVNAPGKALYDWQDIRTYNGASLHRYFASQDENAVFDVCAVMNARGITTLNQLEEWMRMEAPEYLFMLLNPNLRTFFRDYGHGVKINPLTTQLSQDNNRYVKSYYENVIRKLYK